MPNNVLHYIESDLEDGLIVDITADQFGKCPVYVGYRCDLYRRFEFLEANEYTDLANCRLRNIYQAILQYLADAT